MEPLCQELDISVSELLAGKRLEPEQYQKETEKMPTALEKSDLKVQPLPKLVKKIIVYYDDNTFQEFETK